MSSLSDLLSNEVDRLNNKKTNIDSTLSAQTRIMNLNESYRKKYAKYTQLVAVVVFTIIAFLLVNALPKIIPAIPGFVINVLTLIVVIVSLYTLMNIYMEIDSRSNTNYDELDLPPNVDMSFNNLAFGLTQDASANQASNFDLSSIYSQLAQFGITTCVGDDCCPDGWKFDSRTNKCALTNGFTTLEGAYLEEIDAYGFPRSSIGAYAQDGETFSTVGEQYVEDRFKVQPIQ